MSRFINPVPQFRLDNDQVASSGRMYFYENKNFSVLKATYSQPNNTIANTNPLILDGQGRVPPCFGEGLYSVRVYAADPENPGVNGEQIWARDDVSLSELTGQFDLWNPAKIYSINDIAKDPSDGLYYQLYGAVTSTGEQPSTSPTKWELVYFLTGYNSNKTYSEDQIVVDGGFIYRSLEDNNSDNPPSAKWANLTFNDSVAGDFTVGGNLIVGGNIIAESVRVDLGGGFDAAQKVVVERVGKTVTITSVGYPTHPSASTRVSGAIIPPNMRIGSNYSPGQSVAFSFISSAGYLTAIDVNFDGTIRISYFDYAGAAVSRTDTGKGFSVSYTITSETP